MEYVLKTCYELYVTKKSKIYLIDSFKSLTKKVFILKPFNICKMQNY